MGGDLRGLVAGVPLLLAAACDRVGGPTAGEEPTGTEADRIDAAIRERASSLQNCFEAVYPSTPKLAGSTVTVGFTVTSGRVTEAHVVSAEDPRLGGCVVERVRGVRFPPALDTVVVAYAFTGRQGTGAGERPPGWTELTPDLSAPGNVEMVVWGTFRGSFDRFSPCIEAAARRGSNGPVVVSVGFTVVKGSVTEAHVVRSATGDGDLDVCVLDVTRGLPFPQELTTVVSEYAVFG
ncbi:MAG: AgmX/PglI C-terminal domain-containing protein [Myxococcota bacterium]